MSDYISRQDAIDAIELSMTVFVFDEMTIKEVLKEIADNTKEIAISRIKHLPSADAVHGEWIRVGHDIYECSLCHQNVMTKDIDCYSYCHRCGAKMKGGDAEVRNDRTYINEPYMQQSRHDDGRMTREEAIELLEDLDGAIEDNHGRDYDEAFRMAIEALTFEEYGLTCKTCADRNMCIMSAPDGQWKACEDYRPLTEEIAIEFLQDSGWLPNHDKEIGNPSMVVRCKDCRHHGMADCPMWDGAITEDYMWCYFGERREE